MKICLVDYCGKKYHAKGYCNIHYYRLLKWNDLNREPVIKYKTLEEKKANIRRIKNKYKKTEKGRLSSKKYLKGEKGKLSKKLDCSIRRKRIRKNQPKWVNKNEIKEIYKKCPEGYHVDHIVPLKAIHPTTKEHIACGLHVPWNLQYLTKEENIKKRNIMPKELLYENS